MARLQHSRRCLYRLRATGPTFVTVTLHSIPAPRSLHSVPPHLPTTTPPCPILPVNVQRAGRGTAGERWATHQLFIRLTPLPRATAPPPTFPRHTGCYRAAPRVGWWAVADSVWYDDRRWRVRHPFDNMYLGRTVANNGGASPVTRTPIRCCRLPDGMPVPAVLYPQQASDVLQFPATPWSHPMPMACAFFWRRFLACSPPWTTWW